MKRTVLKVFRSDRGGAIAPLVGLSIVALVGFCGIGIDLGVAFNHKRKLQSAVDLAALAASGAKNKVGAATFAMMDNGFSVPTKLEVTPGTYTADRSLALLWQVEGTRQFLADSHAMVMVMDDHDVRCLRVA